MVKSLFIALEDKYVLTGLRHDNLERYKLSNQSDYGEDATNYGDHVEPGRSIAVVSRQIYRHKMAEYHHESEENIGKAPPDGAQGECQYHDGNDEHECAPGPEF